MFVCNTEIFNFCQQCGYKRKRAQDNEVVQKLKKVVVQGSAISMERVEQLARQHHSLRYVREKSAFKQELSNFLFILSSEYNYSQGTREGKFSFRALEPQAAQARLNEYTSAESVRGKFTSDRYTFHGFRSGAAISFALALGISLHEIMDHVGWKNSNTV